MAHEKVFGFCDNKCKVEVEAKDHFAADVKSELENNGIFITKTTQDNIELTFETNKLFVKNKDSSDESSYFKLLPDELVVHSTNGIILGGSRFVELSVSLGGEIILNTTIDNIKFKPEVGFTPLSLKDYIDSRIEELM